MQIPAPTTAHQGPVANQRSKQSGSEESAVGSAQPVRCQHAATRCQSSARSNGKFTLLLFTLFKQFSRSNCHKNSITISKSGFLHHKNEIKIERRFYFGRGGKTKLIICDDDEMGMSVHLMDLSSFLKIYSTYEKIERVLIYFKLNKKFSSYYNEKS